MKAYDNQISKLKKVDRDSIWCQQDGVKCCPTAKTTIEFLREKLWYGIAPKTMWSCVVFIHSTICWAFIWCLWPFEKRKPDSLQSLQVNITYAIHDIQHTIYWKQCIEFVHSIRSCTMTSYLESYCIDCTSQ